MRIIVELYTFKVAALVDTGSDYGAIDRDLSIAQEERPNPAFRGRLLQTVSVCGFSESLNMTSEHVSKWEVTLRGADVPGGRQGTTSLLALLTEFKGLGDPLFLGMPTIDHHGGVETMKKYCWLAGVWIPRFFPPKAAKQTCSAISMVEVDAVRTNCNLSLQQPLVIH